MFVQPACEFKIAICRFVLWTLPAQICSGVLLDHEAAVQQLWQCLAQMVNIQCFLLFGVQC